MESSESSSIDVSSTSSDSTSIQSSTMLNVSKMSFAPQRSESEMKMVQEAVSSLLNTFDQYRPHLTYTQYAYFCKYGTDFLNAEIDKKARKINKRAMGNTTMNMADTASVVGSSRSGSTVPLYQLYPSNQPTANHRYARAPSVASSFVGDFPRQSTFEPLSHRYMLSGHSSGYLSSVPTTGFTSSVDPPYNTHRQVYSQQPLATKSRNDTLMRAIEESEEVSSSPEPVQNRPRNRRPADSRNRQARHEFPTPSTSSSQSPDREHIDERQEQKKVSTAVPKTQKNVIKLVDWSIKLIGEDLCLVGTTRDKSQITSGAVIRYSHPSVVTAKCKFLVVGKPCFGDRTPGYVKSACSNGFPRQWRALSKKWFADRQARDNNSASKATSNATGKAKTSKSTPAKKAGKKSNKNDPSPSSQSDKENKTSRRRSKSMETLKKGGEASTSAPNHKKGRSASTDTLAHGKSKQQKQKKSLPTEDEDESDSHTQVSAKQTKTKVVKSRSNPDVASKKKKQPDPEHDRTDDEDESNSESPVVTKQTKPKVVKSRSDSDSESESDDSIIEPSVNPAKRALQERGSDTSWDTSEKKNDSPTPKAQPKKVVKTKSNNANSESKPSSKETALAKPKKDLAAVPKKPSKVKAKQAPTTNKGRPLATKNDGGPKKGLDIFGDEPERSLATDALSAMGGGDLFSIPCSRSMTPNTLVASIQPDAGTIGRYTPPMQAMLHLFSGNQSSKTNSSFGSPKSPLNNSRDNPVSRRMAKDVASKKCSKQKRKLPELEVPADLENIVKSLRTNNFVKTPTIVKKVFRNRPDTDDDESVITDKDESMVY